MPGRLCLVLILLISRWSLAFGLHEHFRITEQAAFEISSCFPHAFSPGEESILMVKDLEEDINVLRKDLFYSHYYHPFKHLKMHRFDSAVRVENLSENLLRAGPDFIESLGSAIHHLQDMAAPPHVVPVTHWLTDGFEHKVHFDGDISSSFSCDQMQNLLQEKRTQLIDVLQSTAVATLMRVRSVTLPAVQIDLENLTTSKINLPMSAYWQESANENFGKYGFLGNRFGETLIKTGVFTYAISESSYRDYKQAQLRLAVQATVEGLLIGLRPRLMP